MNQECIISYEDIKKYPIHEITEISEYNKPSYSLYQYGPTLAMTNHDIVSRVANDSQIKNILFLFMHDISTILLAVNSEKTYSEAKRIIMDLISKRKVETYEYSDKVIEIASDILTKIREIQYKENSLESAMLNYAPIVPYTGTIVKPEMEDLHQYSNQFNYDTSEITQSMLDERLKSLLVNNIVPILNHHKSFLNTKNYKNGTLPSNLMDLQNIDNPNVREYFTDIYLRYVTPEDKLSEFANKISVIEQSQNFTDLSEVLESFCDIDFKEEDYI